MTYCTIVQVKMQEWVDSLDLTCFSLAHEGPQAEPTHMKKMFGQIHSTCLLKYESGWVGSQVRMSHWL